MSSFRLTRPHAGEKASTRLSAAKRGNLCFRAEAVSMHTRILTPPRSVNLQQLRRDYRSVQACSMYSQQNAIFFRNNIYSDTHKTRKPD